MTQKHRWPRSIRPIAIAIATATTIAAIIITVTMSEDDVDMLGPDGQPPARVDRDRRAPRFSWTPAYETTFFRSLCESVQLGLRENSSFKGEAWERAAVALQESHGAYPTKSHLINKSDNARKRFRLWRGLREDPDFLYNPVTRTVTATEEAWRSHIEVGKIILLGLSPRARERRNALTKLRGNRCREPSGDDPSTTKTTWRFYTRTWWARAVRPRGS